MTNDPCDAKWDLFVLPEHMVILKCMQHMLTVEVAADYKFPYLPAKFKVCSR